MWQSPAMNAQGPFGQIDEIPSYESGCYRRSRLNPSAPLPWQKDRAAAKGSRDGPSLHRNARTREAGCGGITLAPICETDRDNCVARASWLNSRRRNRGRLCQIRFKAPVAQERQIPECHAPALVERKAGRRAGLTGVGRSLAALTARAGIASVQFSWLLQLADSRQNRLYPIARCWAEAHRARQESAKCQRDKYVEASDRPKLNPDDGAVQSIQNGIIRSHREGKPETVIFGLALNKFPAITGLEKAEDVVGASRFGLELHNSVTNQR